MRGRGWAPGWTLVLAAVLLPAAAGARPLDLVLVLLDTTRADRLSVLGNSHQTTPTLDALAAAGVRFPRHFANAHATRASLPQLMSGRYFHQSILTPFASAEHPREFPFSRDDPTSILLPAALRQAGYQTLGASAHTWVTADSVFGHGFDRLDLVPSPARIGHADATQVVDQALALLRGRDAARPLFLYVHLMDMHTPRRLPDGEPRFSVDGFDWRARFSPSGEPLFAPERRRWAREDARDFTDRDREHFAAVYDTRLAHADEQLARLFAALRSSDPGLQHTLVTVVADHGEELGEDGRTDHTASLADGVQHIPWIVAGGPVAPGQRADGMSENVDVVPTLLALTGVPLPSGVRVDGRAQLTGDGRLCDAGGKLATFYAWEDYQAVRTSHYLFRAERPGSLRARCAGATRLYRMDTGRLQPVRPDLHGRRVAARLARLVRRRLGARERTFLAQRYEAASVAVLLRSDFWGIPSSATVRCVTVDASTERGQLPPGWFWTGRGTALMQGPAEPLPVRVSMPDGDYVVEVAAVPIARVPWLWGFPRWLRKSFLGSAPLESVSIGRATATHGQLSIEIPPSAGRHVVGLRLRPPGIAPTTPLRETPEQAEQRRRLKALGYVQ